MTYTINRFYSDDRPAEMIQTGLTLDEARNHCNDPDTSVEGQWFDGYEAES